jgi:hypothetical protein
MNWMIYPAARAFIKVCAVLFGAGAAAAVLIHLFMPFFLRSPRTAAPFLLLGTGAELLSILMFWGARVLLASRGSRITRNLSMLAFLPALYALLIPFAGMPVPSQYTEMDRVWEAVLLLAAVTSFFSFPYTAGYEAAGRRLFLAWGIAAAGCGLQSALFFLAVLLRQFLSTAVPSLAAPVAWLAVLLSCGLEIMLAALSVLLAQRLFKEVMSIASMPEPIDPSMPGNRP